MPHASRRERLRHGGAESRSRLLPAARLPLAPSQKAADEAPGGIFGSAGLGVGIAPPVPAASPSTAAGQAVARPSCAGRLELAPLVREVGHERELKRRGSKFAFLFFLSFLFF